jgi:hypothetical protein
MAGRRCSRCPVAGLLVLGGIALQACGGQPAAVRLEYGVSGEALVLDVDITGLRKESPYQMSLQGKAGQDGNECLRTFKASGEDGSMDLLAVYTDARGRLTYRGEVDLPRCKYDVAFVVKDSIAGHVPVLVREHWRFEIPGGEK